jgi:hypothetical protein
LLLNLTFGKGIGLDCQLGYSIDGQSYGEIPMNSPPTKEYRTIIQMEVPPLQLPTLKDGPHNLTINVNASTEGYTHSWVHTICFTVDSSSSPTLTPVTVTMPSPTPMEITAANPSQTVLSPTSDQQPPTPLAAIIILVAAAVYITAVIVLATLKGKR